MVSLLIPSEGYGSTQVLYLTVLGTQGRAGCLLYTVGAAVGLCTKDPLPHMPGLYFSVDTHRSAPIPPPRRADTQVRYPDSQDSFPTCPPPPEPQVNKAGTNRGIPYSVPLKARAT